MPERLNIMLTVHGESRRVFRGWPWPDTDCSPQFVGVAGEYEAVYDVSWAARRRGDVEC